MARTGYFLALSLFASVVASEQSGKSKNFELKTRNPSASASSATLGWMIHAWLNALLFFDLPFLCFFPLAALCQDLRPVCFVSVSEVTFCSKPLACRLFLLEICSTNQESTPNYLSQ